MSDINQEKVWSRNDVVNLGNALNNCSKLFLEIIQFTCTIARRTLLTEACFFKLKPYRDNDMKDGHWIMWYFQKYAHPLLYYIVLPICSFKLAH